MIFYRNTDTPGAILTEDEARQQWAKDHSDESHERFFDYYKRVTGSEAVLADIKHVIATHAPADKFKYQLLDRLRMDCDYFLGNGNRCARHLWAGAVGTHIDSMMLLYDSFPEDARPEWLKREQIEAYREEMNPQKGTAILDPVAILERLENVTFDDFGYDHKPAGAIWLKMVLNIAERITDTPDLLDAITSADLDQLTEDNYHTARHAAEILLNLKKFTL